MCFMEHFVGFDSEAAFRSGLLSQTSMCLAREAHKQHQISRPGSWPLTHTWSRSAIQGARWWEPGLSSSSVQQRIAALLQDRGTPQPAFLELWVPKSRASGVPPSREVPLALGAFPFQLGGSVVLLPLGASSPVFTEFLGKKAHLTLQLYMSSWNHELPLFGSS